MINRVDIAVPRQVLVALVALALALFFASACKGKRDSGDQSAGDMPNSMARVTSKAQEDPKEEEEEMEFADDVGGTGTAMALDEGKMGKADKASRRPRSKRSKKKGGGSVLGKDRKPGAGKGGEASGERGVQTRSWFPETFLFEPLVITDEQGAASLDVTVPDRLTTWRVLALAHSRVGGQAGTTASFLGTLPAYVDPVVPSLLRAGDSIRLPIQLVNTTPDEVQGELVLEAVDATLDGGAGPATIPGQSNIVRYTTLTTAKPGAARLLARLGQTDAVVRTTDVVPTGRPVLHSQSGTLAAVRQYDIASPQNANPALGRVRLQVFPGALSILRTELSASIYRGGVADDAFALLLAGKAPEAICIWLSPGKMIMGFRRRHVLFTCSGSR